MTEYEVLEERSIEDAVDGAKGWVHVSTEEARSGKSAIRNYLSVSARPNGQFRYVAVPTRSWDPVTAELVTELHLKLS